MKVWFQNRRMKHKRQTLGKQGDDGDDKDSITSDGGKSVKMSDKFLDDEMSKKSCQGCEMPTAGLCGTHEEVPDLVGSTRVNNNNTPSATNNNTSFNTNSNGASSVASSGSFDKIIAEDDSRSNEENGSAQTSPRLKKVNMGTNIVKVENRRNSPNIVERKIAMCKISPSQKEQMETNKVNSKNMTPPAVSGTPTLGINANNIMYPHLQRSSPTTATAIASATVTIQNVPPFATRGTTNQFQNQYQMNSQVYNRNESRQTKQQYQVHSQAGYATGDMYNPDHPTVNDGQPYVRNQTRSEITGRVRNRQSYHSYPNQYYNYNKNPNETYNMNSQTGYVQGYQSEQSYNHYGYPAASMYPADGSDNMGAHMHNSVHMGHEHTTTPYYSNDNMHQMHKVEGSEYVNKVGYYENAAYNTSTADSTYIGSEVYPNNTAAIMTPPTSVQTDSSDTYSNFQQFYPGENQQQAQVTAPTGENSNSSSDFNFLSNLANDYTPEYYQI